MACIQVTPRPVTDGMHEERWDLRDFDETTGWTSNRNSAKVLPTGLIEAPRLEGRGPTMRG